MRARHRHFNARHAGADLVLDARYINQSDNTSVSAWTDRSANNHSIAQSTAANQPTFRTNQMNGNPVVRFDGSNDFLDGGDILYILNRGMTLICVAKISGGTNPTLVGKSRFGVSEGRYSLVRDNNTFLALYQEASNAIAQVSDTSTANRINTMAINRGATNTLFFDGAQQAQNTTLSGSTSYDNTNVFLVGVYQNSTGGTPPQSTYYLNGDIAQIVVNFTFNTPLRKRLEHAAAYSFKIACS